MTPCTSSLIASYQYDADAELLTIVFRTNGDIRHYESVPIELFWGFEATESKGTFYNQRIKGRFSVTSSGKVAVDVLPPAEVVPEIMSPDQAVAVISPKNPKADELTKRLHTMAASTNGILVKDAGTQRQMETHLVAMTTVRKVLFDIIDPYRAIAYAAYEQIQRLNKSRLDPVDAALKDGKLALTTYLAAEQRKAQEEQRRLQVEADAVAEADRLKRTEELRLQVAQEFVESGDTEQAEKALADETIQAALMQVYAPRVEAPTSALGGRANWKARVVDAEAAILDVAEGIKSMKAGKGLQGHAPMTILKFDDSGLKSLATANKTMFSFPGLQAYDDRVLSTTKLKG